MIWSRKSESSDSAPSVEPHVFQSVSVPATLSGRGIQPLGQNAGSTRCAVCFRFATDPIHRETPADSPRWGF